MRKIAAVSILILFSMMCAFSDGWEGTSTHGDLSFTAYKDLPLPALFGFEINISNAKDDSVVGSSGEYRMEQEDLGSGGNLFGNALTVSVGTNSRNPVNVGLWFSPFRATVNGENVIMPVTWTITTEPDDTYSEGMQYGEHFYRYYLDYSFEDTSGVDVASVSTAKTGVNAYLVFSPVAQSKPLSGGTWEDVSVGSLPDCGNVLPGFTQENGDAKLHASATFSLTLGTVYNKLADNVKYSGTVRITVEGD